MAEVWTLLLANCDVSGTVLAIGGETLVITHDMMAEGTHFRPDADMADGLLIINLVREVPEALKPRKIAIGPKLTSTVIEHDAAPKKKGPQAV